MKQQSDADLDRTSTLIAVAVVAFVFMVDVDQLLLRQQLSPALLGNLLHGQRELAGQPLPQRREVDVEVESGVVDAELVVELARRSREPVHVVRLVRLRRVLPESNDEALLIWDKCIRRTLCDDNDFDVRNNLSMMTT